MLEVKDLHCSYGTTQVLKGVDLNVNKGEVISILGSSGSGKTTLLRCISFLQKADSGTIRFDDFEKDITQLKHSEIRALRMKMGYVFQNFNLFRNMTVKQNVLEGLITARGVDRATADKTADEVLEKVGMLHRKDFYPDQLSGGQQQRVAIARAIAFKPEVLLFDEPTSALDPELTREVLNTITQLAADGLTLVVVTHEMGFARNVSDRIIFMENGVVAEEAPAKEFFLRVDELSILVVGQDIAQLTNGKLTERFVVAVFLRDDVLVHVVGGVAHHLPDAVGLDFKFHRVGRIVIVPFRTLQFFNQISAQRQFFGCFHKTVCIGVEHIRFLGGAAAGGVDHGNAGLITLVI